jgi:hypothetical protein
MAKLIFVALVAAAVIVPGRMNAQTQTSRAQVSIPQRTIIHMPRLRALTKKRLLRHPTAAERHLLPADLVAVTGPRGEKRFVRRSTPK